MSNFALYAQGSLANSRSWSSRIYASGSVSEATAATAIHTAWGALWTAITASMPTTSTVTETFAVTMSPTWRFTTSTSTAETLAGTSASKSMPITTAPMITWRTASRQKGKNGRSFLPAAAVNAIDTASSTGELLAAFNTAVKTGATSFFNDLVSAGLTPVLLDRPTLTTMNISGPQVSNVFRTQKNRGRKIVPTFS